MSKASSDAAFVAQFVRWAAQRNFSYVDQSIKQRLHREAKTVLRYLARALGLQPGDYEVRSNLGGIAVSGEITLHAATLYVQISDSAMFGRDMQILYRRCQHLNDYCGGRNHFARLTALLDLNRFAAQLKAM